MQHFTKPMHAGAGLLATLVSCWLLSLSACTSRKNDKQIPKEDSAKIYAAVVELKERIYDHQKLSAENLKKLLTPKDAALGDNAVKQIHFTWHDYGSGFYGLDAYGADERGQALNDAIPLEIDKTDYQTNFNEFNRKMMVIRRGDLKYLFGSANRRANSPINPEELKDIFFSATFAPYPESDDVMYFSVKKSAEYGTKLLAGAVIYANPSPPYNSICDNECDN